MEKWGSGWLNYVNLGQLCLHRDLSPPQHHRSGYCTRQVDWVGWRVVLVVFYLMSPVEDLGKVPAQQDGWGWRFSVIQVLVNPATPLQLVWTEEASWMKGGASSRSRNKSGCLRYSTLCDAMDKEKTCKVITLCQGQQVTIATTVILWTHITNNPCESYWWLKHILPLRSSVSRVRGHNNDGADGGNIVLHLHVVHYSDRTSHQTLSFIGLIWNLLFVTLLK